MKLIYRRPPYPGRTWKTMKEVPQSQNRECTNSGEEEDCEFRTNLGPYRRLQGHLRLCSETLCLKKEKVL